MRNLTTLSTIWTGWSGLMELYLRTSFEALQIDFCILAQKSLVQYRVESCDYQCCFALTLALDIFQTQTTLPCLRAPVVSMWICVLLNWFLPSTHLTSKHKQNYLQYKHKFSFKYLSIYLEENDNFWFMWRYNCSLLWSHGRHKYILNYLLNTYNAQQVSRADRLITD